MCLQLYELVASGVPALIRTASSGSQPPLVSRLDPRPAHESFPTTHAGSLGPPPIKAADSPLFGHLPASPCRTAFHDTFPSLHPSRAALAHDEAYPPQHPYDFSGPFSEATAGEPARSPPQRRSRFPPARPGWAPEPLPQVEPLIPPEPQELPWGAQMYVKRVRAMQEQEEREARRQRAARAVPPAGHRGAFTFEAAPAFRAPGRTVEHYQQVTRSVRDGTRISRRVACSAGFDSESDGMQPMRR